MKIEKKFKNEENNKIYENTLYKMLDTDTGNEINKNYLWKIIDNRKKTKKIKKNNNFRIIISIIAFGILIIFIIDIISKIIIKKYICYPEIIICLIYLLFFIFLLFYFFKNYNKNKKIYYFSSNEEILYLRKESNLNKKDLKLYNNITKDSYSHWRLGNSFTVFKSINNILYLVYSTENKSIIFFNLFKNQKISEIKNAHINHISIFKYCLDRKNKRDILMSVSGQDNNIKIWDVNSCTCLLDLMNVNKSGQIFSVSFLNCEDDNYNYIVSSNFSLFNKSEPIKIYDLNGNKIKEINDSNEDVYSVITYYDEELLTNFILTANNDCVCAYNYNKNNIYHKYFDNTNVIHRYLIIFKFKKIVEIIVACDDGNVRIWNFHNCTLLDIIKVSESLLYGICLWNYNYLFVGLGDNSIILLDLKKRKIIKSFIGHTSNVSSIQKVDHPQYGECLLSQGWFKDQIKIWIDIDLLL